MRINKKISALLCSVAMCCSNGQISKTSASFLGYFFSAVAVQKWITLFSRCYCIFKSKSIAWNDTWFLRYYTTGGEKFLRGTVSEGLREVGCELSRLEFLEYPIVFTYLACEEFRKEKENNKRASNENMYVDPKNSKDKKYDTNK